MRFRRAEATGKMERSELRLQKQRWYPRRPEAQRAERVGEAPGSAGRRAGRGGTWPRPQPIFPPAHSTSHVGACAWAGRSLGEKARRRLGASSASQPGEKRTGGRGGACCGGRSLLLGLAQETGLRGPAYWLRAPGLLVYSWRGSSNPVWGGGRRRESERENAARSCALRERSGLGPRVPRRAWKEAG